MMHVERMSQLQPRMQTAIAELQAMIRRRYPAATFRIACNPEDSEMVLLKPTVDVDDRDEVVDVVIDRLLELQTDEHLPLLVVPVRPKARNDAIRRTMREAAPSWGTEPPPVQS
jgi:hypothetical protein